MSTHSTTPPGLIGRYLPEFSFRHCHGILVDCDDIGEVYKIARDVDLSRSPVVPLLFKLRGLPVSRLNARAFTKAMGWADLQDAAPNEFVIGYRRRGRIEPVLAPYGSEEDAIDVRQKVAFSFRFSQQADGRVLVSTETRVLCIGRGATLRFWPYWIAIKPFSSLIRREILRLIKQEAEQRMRRRRQQAAEKPEPRPTGPPSPPMPGASLPRPRTVVQLPTAVVVPLRAFFRITSRVWPTAAIGTFKWLMSRMPKRPLRDGEQTFLGGAERLNFQCGDTVLAGYAFGRGPTVLVAHGLLGSSANFREMIPALVQRGYRVVAVDSLNHGNSPAGSIVSPAPVRHFTEVMRQLGDLHAVIAHSAGTYVAMMALLDVPPGVRLKKCVYLAPYPDLESSLISFMDYFAIPDRLAPPLRRWFERIGGTRPLAQQSFQACLPLHRTPEPPSSLFIHDVDDLYAPVHRTRQMLAGSTASRLLLTRGLGHFRILKDPMTIEHIGAFLDEELAVRDKSQARAQARPIGN